MVTGPPIDRSRAVGKLANQAVDAIHRLGFAIFRIGRLRLSVEESRSLAITLADRIRVITIGLGAPADLWLEIDEPQTTHVPTGYRTRTLLPHHDGQHCSYLTPSLHDVPNWDPALREFGQSGYSTTHRHKMYQGIFLSAVGEGLSVTTYYDWLAIIDDVLGRGVGTQVDRPRVAARWVGNNLIRALENQPSHGCPYPAFAAMLGIDDQIWHAISVHHAEAELTHQERERLPAAVALGKECPCGNCHGTMARLFCHQTLRSTGRDWSQFRQKWEILAPGDQCDFIIGHNLTMLHGGWAGGAGRVIEPLCLVVDRPEGAEYERWLAASWRRTLPGDRP